MNKQLDMFDGFNIEDKSPVNVSSEERTPENALNELKNVSSYKITKTDMNLTKIGDKLSTRYNWITNSIVPYSASNLIHVQYYLDYDSIYKLYEQGRILTYQVDNEYTTWINKSVKKQKKTNHQKR